LTGEARAYFLRQSRRLHGLRLLTEIDVETLVLAAQSYKRWLQAEEAVEKSLMATGRLNRLRVVVATKYASQYLQLAREFGLSPAARVRLETGDHDLDDALGILS
jgi:P27 family predicted phage terminase small subunit